MLDPGLRLNCFNCSPLPPESPEIPKKHNPMCDVTSWAPLWRPMGSHGPPRVLQGESPGLPCLHLLSSIAICTSSSLPWNFLRTPRCRFCYKNQFFLTIPGDPKTIKRQSGTKMPPLDPPRAPPETSNTDPYGPRALPQKLEKWTLW